MNAKEKSFRFMSAAMCIEVPYFQRAYVWNKDNWEELLNNLLENGKSHFLGSIILKQMKTKSGDVQRWSVIDGQQRLTTLSILLRACFDALPMENYDESVKNTLENNMRGMLFYTKSQLEVPKEIKIRHSLIDKQDYQKVIEGKAKEEIDKIILDSEVKKGERASTSNILKCYKYFYKELCDKPENSSKLWEVLLNEQNNILVEIDLGEDENEQAIFDTINSAGVRLTCADTVKNALFQKGIENAGQDEREKEKIIQAYKENWYDVFSLNQETIEYWNEERQLGRLKRDNLEVLLHCVALIKNFYDPEQNTISDLPKVYKEYCAGFDNLQLLTFVKELKEYAQIFRKFFYAFEKTTLFEYENHIQRLFHILSVCEVSTLHPYILKLFKDYNIQTEDELPKTFYDELKKIENFVIRHIVSNTSMKNFNKVCALLIAGKTTIDKEMEEKKETLCDEAICASLYSVRSNKIATLILFWIELKRRSLDGKYATKELKYVYSLEHIMPQAWEAYWGINDCEVYSYETGKIISDVEMAKDVRKLAIYEIGNMTLLTTSLNATLKNYDISQKIDGSGKKKGISYYADLSVAQDVVEVYRNEKKWNEILIRKRTEELCKEFLKIW